MCGLSFASISELSVSKDIGVLRSTDVPANMQESLTTQRGVRNKLKSWMQMLKSELKSCLNPRSEIPSNIFIPIISVKYGNNPINPIEISKSIN